MTEPLYRIIRPFPTRPLDRAWTICVSGGIGSGKSAFTRALHDCGATCFDADAVLRAATGAGGKALPALRKEFGDGIFIDPNHLNRTALAALIFSDHDAKTRLEAILHPLVWERLDQVTARLNPPDLLVAEIPLVAETGRASRFDIVVMIDAPSETRFRRLNHQRAMSESQTKARIAAQATRRQREAIAHVWIDNTRSLTELQNTAKQLWKIWLKA